MKIAIFGGTGKTGQHLVQQALDAGHEVVMLARTPSNFTIRHPKLTVLQGDILDAEHVEAVIQGTDAVMSVLGPRSNKPEFVISQGIDHILNAMKQHNVRRIIISAGAGVRDPLDKPKFIDHLFGFLLNLLSKNAVEDMKQVVAKVRDSDRDWSVIRVPMLTDQPPQGTLKIGYVGDITSRLSRADMAAFMLKQLDDDTYLKKAPAISN
ncbi:MAG: SDR family oxidoreductase [Anaerolineae bacterium]|nr:SDR family oxidoreductase [Anaerolineae bacterium]